jgi:hypothetical protein
VPGPARMAVGDQTTSTLVEDMMQRMGGTWKTQGARLALPLLLAGVHAASAGGFGIAQLDAFLTTFLTGVTGLGVLVGSVGLVGYVGSLMDNPFSTILSGSIGFFTKAGILGGGTAMLTGLGLVTGGTF